MAKFIVFQTKWEGEKRQIDSSALIEANESYEAEEKAAETLHSDPSDFYAFEVTEAWTAVIKLIREGLSKLT